MLFPFLVSTTFMICGESTRKVFLVWFKDCLLILLCLTATFGADHTSVLIIYAWGLCSQELVVCWLWCSRDNWNIQDFKSCALFSFVERLNRANKNNFQSFFSQVKILKRFHGMHDKGSFMLSLRSLLF